MLTITIVSNTDSGGIATIHLVFPNTFKVSVTNKKKNLSGTEVKFGLFFFSLFKESYRATALQCNRQEQARVPQGQAAHSRSHRHASIVSSVTSPSVPQETHGFTRESAQVTAKHSRRAGKICWPGAL